MHFLKKFERVLSWILVMIWMAIIFYLSHQPAGTSSELSSGITAFIVDFIVSVTPFQLAVDDLHFWIRKGAHFFAYFTLGVLSVHALRNENWLKRGGLALLICILYAISDEIHQLFIPGRSGEVRDVLIDSAGAIIGISFYLFIVTVLLKRCQQSGSTKKNP